MRLHWLPNSISILRIVLIVPYALSLKTNNSSLAIGLAIVIVLSDIVDGFLARKLKNESKLGELLDSLADGFFIIITWIVFFLQNKYGTLIFINLLIPRLLMAASIIIYRIRNHEWNFQHKLGNKIGGATYFISILWMILNFPYATVVLWTTICVNYISLITSSIERFEK